MYDEPEYDLVARRHGACGLVSKDTSAEALVTAIKTAYRGEDLPSACALSPRERETLALIARGLPNEEIAADLAISPKTVEHHCQRLMEKLGIHTRAGLVAYARRIGLGESG